MKIYFAADHAGFDLKETLLAFVRDELGHEVEDMGAYSLVAGDDYPDFVVPAAQAVGADALDATASGNNNGSYAIVIGGSGQGEAMAANRVKGVRAVVWYGGNQDIVTLSRQHNDANVLSIGARFVNEHIAKDMVALWLTTEFSGDERHIRRNSQIDSLE